MKRYARCSSIALLLLFAACQGAPTSGIESEMPRFEQGAIATVDPLAEAAGKEVLQLGGNAMDAAVAVGFALAVVHPQAGNLGGGGFMVVYQAESGHTEAIDFREEAPGRAYREMFLDDEGKVIPLKSKKGSWAIGVPGSVAGLTRLHWRHGVLSLERVMKPAIRLAAEGFEVPPRLADSLASQWIRLEPDARKLFERPDGTPLRAGDTLKQPALARVLRAIAEEGPSVFYRGWIAKKLAAYVESRGGLLRYPDLAGYRAIVREPIRFRYRNVEVASMPLPSSGGIVLGQILGMLAGFDLSQLDDRGAPLVHRVAECSERAFADRAEFMGDPAYSRIRVEQLLADDYLAKRREGIALDRATDPRELGPGKPYHEPTETTHFSVVDRHGNAVSLTTSLNYTFGGGMAVPELGFMLNDHMDDFSVRPGFPNLYGLVGGAVNEVQPGKRPLSSMSPTIVFEDGQPVLVLGARGGPRIISSVLWTILMFVDFGMPIEQAVAHPRAHHQWLPPELWLEPGFGERTIEKLQEMGHVIEEKVKVWEVHAVAVEDGRLKATGDPRWN